MTTEGPRSIAAANRDVNDESPGPFQDCRDVVHIAVFFDGTGNNRTADDATSSWSNVGRIFDAAISDPSKAIYRIYVSGVGTKFNGDSPGWLASAGAMIEDKLGGLGFGAGGDRRMEFGDAQVNDRLRDALILNAEKQGGELAKYAKDASEKSFDEVNRTLGRHRLIKIINISVFGFSRGAALARAFANRIVKSCTLDGNDLIYAGYPIRMNFLGIFDTVASFGVPSQNARTPFTERELIVSPLIQRCVHYVAAHEVRFAFPVDLIRKDGKLAGDWLEKVYPGVHSDVGGGYGPQDQGIDNNYSRIPMRDMMGEAILGGVRVRAYGEIARVNEPLFAERFECREETEASYRNYMTAFGSPAGDIEGHIKQHMRLLYTAYGTMHRLGMETAGQRRLKEDKYKYIGPKGMAWEVTKYRAAANAGKTVRIGGAAVNSYAQFVKPQDWQLECWDTKAPDGVLNFVARYVHDSKVDFIANLGDPFSYFKARGVQESTISVWAEAGSWIRSTAASIADSIGGAVGRGKSAVSDAIDKSTDTARQSAEAIAQAAREKAAAARQRALEAAEAARQEVERAEQFGAEVIDEAAQTARAAANAALQRADQAALYAETLAREADEAAESLIDGAKQGANAAARKTGKVLDETLDSGERLIDSGISWIKNVVPSSTDNEKARRP
ncbi:T6SS phospholipase effector Tle1-like catalytic domain-containing protein [Pseudoduganella albidiflava]|uniref:DUF2235 domain-containing protein n=1 Tax=Pseudoduganella albidiflava TaxID=321983 RepID=A0A411X166_9BURK|nr:DUF2235 domain-containing protein [Pseudoduganella albidiflava]QBI02701.1 DUF2235 domain-containing protein [Pseudoduganella albidiflava]GGY68584.1 hypothetical protein GCM10007387_58350 [Pseudoduganella albidiflava]